ncbi:adenosylcobinamide-GDP ribazoletransferase [Novosphingobium sp. P6W]|uniref:adenosylcobinamide-GDP ribazoletransferase n=1 Tax=Novosphingobium sp. P6W TaxID=1609758 RepID=UPI0005C2E7B9|nr:adenosylcobinamide-GDP ribazoletransferase [Novosphingobium sp. P6W]AXB75118.1 adenosylcobinamide-GDP ribazoletransferase [Novosphingobium sp. P6W]KIS32822.1 cobalamin synthase [Novosphingobium sp. P6W]
MKGLILALQFLTRLPLPQVQADRQDFARAMRWFPVAGLAVAAAVAGPWWLLHSRGPWLAALAGLTGWIAITGALHLDGLGDVADGAGAAHGGRTRLSAVMADPHVGSFAVVVIVLQLMAKLVLLNALPVSKVAALIAVPVLARIAPIAWTLFLPPLHEGLGTAFRSGVGRLHLLFWSLVAIAAALLLDPALLALFIAIPLWGWWLQTRLGGISGDGHGAGIELLETAMLAALVLMP